MHKQKFPAEIKIRIVESILEGQTTQGKAADLLGANKATIQGWIHIYQTFGQTGFAARKTAQIFTEKEKKAAVEEYLQGKGSLADISRKHRIRTKSTLLKWVEQYNHHIEFREPGTHGEYRSEVYMRKGRATTQKERIEMVSYCIEHGMDYALVVEKYGVSYNQIYSWVKKFRESGVQGLEDRRGKKRLVSEMSEVEQLRAENRILKKQAERLELENIILKKRRELERGRF